MIRTLIIEDESPAAQRLERLLPGIDPDIHVETVLDSVEASVTWLKSHPHPDLMLVDIQLADGSSFAIFRQVHVDSFVIFTTAYDEYALKAFELNSIDYLLKPFTKERLQAAIAKFRNLRHSPPPVDIEQIIASIESRQSRFRKRFAIRLGTRIRSIETHTIACFRSVEKNTFLCTFEGKEYPVDFSLDRLESQLDPDVFFRINRQFMVNFRAISRIAILSKSRLEISVSGLAEPLPVSMAKAHAFRGWLDR